jgi:hypothetical protein
VWPEDIVTQDGVAHLWITDTRPAAEQEALRVAAKNVPGVRRVEEHIVPVPSFPRIKTNATERLLILPDSLTGEYLLRGLQIDGCRRAYGICCADRERRTMQ